MFKTRAFVFVCALSVIGVGSARAQQNHATSQSRSAATKQAEPKLDPKKQFVVDVVSAAVSVPQSDQGDRLRVLTAASSVVMPTRPAMAREFSREGLRIEQEMIERGELPPASMIGSGAVDCRAVQSLVENVPANRVDSAESTLIAAVERCRGSIQTAQRLISAGLEKRVPAPRLTVAVLQRVGVNSEWSKQTLDDLFASLPTAHESAGVAPEFATLYSEVADRLSPEEAAHFGVRLLSWLSQMNPGRRRNLAVNVTTGAMKHRLGEEQYNKALGADAAALQVSQTQGQTGDLDRRPEESVSVLRAMQSSNDRTDELERMPVSLRAREAAASGFAAGTQGNNPLAEHYFDIAFRALEDVWSQRGRQQDAADVVQEVSEAAAQVHPVKALQRSQRLQDPAVQAIAMIAVARVVANR